MQHQMFISTTRIIAQYLPRLLFQKEIFLPNNRFLNLLFFSFYILSQSSLLHLKYIIHQINNQQYIFKLFLNQYQNKFSPNLLPIHVYHQTHSISHIQNSSSTYTTFTSSTWRNINLSSCNHPTRHNLHPSAEDNDLTFLTLDIFFSISFFHHATTFHGSGIIFFSPAGIFTLVHTLLFQLWFERSICRWPSPRNERGGIS